MGSRIIDIDDQSTVDGTPEDVAALYSWANLQGAKYRDYSASRREYRAQVRYRAAKDLLERELAGQAKALAAQSERAAIETQDQPDPRDAEDPQRSWTASPQHAEDVTQKASSERVEAARRAQAVALAGVLALREEREIAEAHSSALRQALFYKESELRRLQLAGPQPHERPADWPAPATAAAQPQGGDRSPAEGVFALTDPALNAERAEIRGSRSDEEASTPAWLNASQPTVQPQSTTTAPQTFRGDSAGGDTLQDSRERLAARWFALKGIFEHAGPELPARQPLLPGDGKTPLLAVFSLAGGVGKTSLVATLGRALAMQGEKVVLADTTSDGLLGIYFGSRDALLPVAESPLPPKESTDPFISVVIRDFSGRADDDRQRGILTEEILRNCHGHHRLLLDLSAGSSWLIGRLLDLHPTVLVPIAPDMNSVISLRAVERMFRGFIDSEGRPLLPFYVLNQFDSSLALHLDVREVFRRQLADRLLQSAIRRSPAVSEALADGMTVLDYAPQAPVAQDYRDIALWLRSISPPATEESRRARWGER